VTPSNSIPEDKVLHDARRADQIVAKPTGLSLLEAVRRVADVYAQTQARVRGAEEASRQA
jgi:hypothetical protein